MISDKAKIGEDMGVTQQFIVVVFLSRLQLLEAFYFSFAHQRGNEIKCHLSCIHYPLRKIDTNWFHIAEQVQVETRKMQSQ